MKQAISLASIRSDFTRVPRLATNAWICAGGNCRVDMPAASKTAQTPVASKQTTDIFSKQQLSAMMYFP